MDTGIIIWIVVATALAFDFTNGFHDTANSMATTIATGALKPRMAVALAAVLNFAGAFISLAVAATIAKGIVDQDTVTLATIFGGLIGAILWNLTTWFFGLPSSSSHALIGGVIGATVVVAGWQAVETEGVVAKVIIPAVLSPILACTVAFIATKISRRSTAKDDPTEVTRGYKAGQIASSSLLSLAHGTNDAQKTMGIITLALIANGTIAKDAETPMWVVVAAATAIGLGTYLGGWRIIHTLGKKMTDIRPAQGFSANTGAATVILAASHVGFPLSTTHVAAGSVIGSGVGAGARVDWGIARNMVGAWVLTLPGAGIVGALSAWVAADLIGGTAGILVVAAITGALAAGLWWMQRSHAVTHHHFAGDEDVETLTPAGAEAVLPHDAVKKQKALA